MKKNMKHQILAASTSAALVASVVAPIVAPAPSYAVSSSASFPDMTEKYSWAFPAVDYLIEKGAIKGKPDGTYQPEQPIKRAEAAKILALMLNLDVKEGAQTHFEDAKNHWASKYIAAIVSQKPGIIQGYPDGTFRPDGQIKRQELAKMIVEAYNLQLDANADIHFSDNTDWGKDYVNILASLGIVTGKGAGKFDPGAFVKRVETPVFIYRTEVEDARVDVPQKVKVIESINATSSNTIIVNFGNESYEIELNEALVHGENDVTFEINGVTYTETVVYDAIPGALEAAETAIAELPEDITLADKNKVEETRELVKVVYSLDENAEIEGIDTLGAAEERISELEAEAAEKLAKAIDDAESAISALPETITIDDAEAVQSARSLVEAAVVLDENVEIIGLDKLEAAEESIAILLEEKEAAEQLANAIAEAEKAIRELPAKITADDAEQVEAARYLVNQALELDSRAVIKNLSQLEEAESYVNYYVNGTVTVNKSSYVLKPGDTYQLTASISPQVEGISLTWSSNNTKVVTVDSDGTITAVSEGKATITVETEDGKKATTQVTVSEKPVLNNFSIGSSSRNDIILSISGSFINYGFPVTVEKVEILDDNQVRTSYNKNQLDDQGIPTEIGYGEKFGISISYRFGLQATGDVYIKYTVSNGAKTFEFISELR